MRRRPLPRWLIASLWLGASACVPVELIPRPDRDAGPTSQDMPGAPAPDMSQPPEGSDMPSAEMGGGELTNPLEGDPAAIMAGQMRFMSSCTICHSPTGEATLTAEKALRETASEASDGYIFTTIRDGQDTSPMPSYGEALSEDELWELVSFIRTLDDA